MIKRQHGFDVGIYWLNGVDSGNSTAAQLKTEIGRAYEGEETIEYEACNVIHSVGDDLLWGAGPNAIVANNIAGFIIYLKQIEALNLERGYDPLGCDPPPIRGTISRDICGLVYGGTTKWDPETVIKPYIQGLCYAIRKTDVGTPDERDLSRYVAGWFFGNEILSVTRYPSAEWGVAQVREVAQAVHWAQKNPEEYGAGTDTADPCNFPYYWADFMGTTTATTGGDPDNPRAFWVRTTTDPQKPRDFKVSAVSKSWVDVFTEPELSDAKLIFQPHFYPWDPQTSSGGTTSIGRPARLPSTWKIRPTGRGGTGRRSSTRTTRTARPSRRTTPCVARFRSWTTRSPSSSFSRSSIWRGRAKTRRTWDRIQAT